MGSDCSNCDLLDLFSEESILMQKIQIVQREHQEICRLCREESSCNFMIFSKQCKQELRKLQPNKQLQGWIKILMKYLSKENRIWKDQQLSIIDMYRSKDFDIQSLFDKFDIVGSQNLQQIGSLSWQILKRNISIEEVYFQPTTTANVFKGVLKLQNLKGSSTRFKLKEGQMFFSTQQARKIIYARQLITTLDGFSTSNVQFHGYSLENDRQASPSKENKYSLTSFQLKRDFMANNNYDEMSTRQNSFSSQSHQRVQTFQTNINSFT